MNSEALYQAIGHIDDEYIIEASEKKQASKSKIYVLSTLAASIILFLAFNAFNTGESQVIFNQIQILNTKEVSIDTSDLTKGDEIAYLDGLVIPNKLASLELRRQVSDLYIDSHKQVVYDKFVFDYSGSNDEHLTITTSKINTRSYFGTNNEESVINDEKVLLGIVENAYSSQAYYAEIRLDDILITLRSEGISQDDFIEIIQNLID